MFSQVEGIYVKWDQRPGTLGEARGTKPMTPPLGEIQDSRPVAFEKWVEPTTQNFRWDPRLKILLLGDNRDLWPATFKTWLEPKTRNFE